MRTVFKTPINNNDMSNSINTRNGFRNILRGIPIGPVVVNYNCINAVIFNIELGPISYPRQLFILLQRHENFRIFKNLIARDVYF